MIYLTITLIISLFSLFLFSHISSSMKITRLNMISWTFYFSLVTQCVISSVIVVNFWEDHYRISKQLTNPESRYIGWLAIQWVMLSLPIGMIISNTLFRVKSGNKVFLNYISSPITFFSQRNNKTILLCLFALSLICIISVFYTFYSIGYLPQKALFSIGGLISSEIRNEVGREFTGNSIFRNIFAITLTPIISYVWYAYYKLNPKLVYKVLFYLFLVLSILIVTYNLAKAPLLFYLLGFVFLRVYINGRVNFKNLMIIGLLAFLLLILFYYLTFESFDILHLLSPNTGIGGRIFLGQSMGVYFSFDIFPVQEPHIYFSSFSRKIAEILGSEYSERSSRILMEVLNPGGIKNGTAGVLNSLFIAEAWANLGYLGFFLSPIIVGFYIQTLFLFFITSKKTPIYLGLFAYFSYRLPVVGSFNEFLYNPVQLIIFTLILFVMLFASKRKTS